MEMIRRDQCKFCNSTKCHTRIVTKDMVYDEIACGSHIRDLELDADNTLGRNIGVLRDHISSTAKLSRG